MRPGIVFALILGAGVAVAQNAPWKQVSPSYDPPQLSTVTPSTSQMQAMDRLFKSRAAGQTWECPPEELKDLVRGMTFKTIPLSASAGAHVLLVEAGEGCARGGQGSNGAMWLIRLDGDKPAFLATPKDGFSGWLYSIQPAATNGYHDLVLGWHVSASESGLQYFRFDGKRYQPIGSATREGDDPDKGTIIPK